MVAEVLLDLSIRLAEGGDNGLLVHAAQLTAP
jgi:hypothetical protein